MHYVLIKQTRFSITALVCLVLAATLPIASVQAEGPTAAEYGTVLNLAGRQRMLTQKMSKETMLIALGVDTAGNLENLKATATLFDTTLKGLKDGSAELGLPPTTDPRILRQLTKVEEMWAEFSPVITSVVENGAVTAEQITGVAAQNVPLLKQMNKTVRAYEKDAAKGGLSADPGLAATINLAGRQRMLTQKMSKEFLLIAYGHNADANRLSLLETSGLFDQTLNGLFNGDEVLDLPGNPSATIRAQLEVVQGLWGKMQPIVEAGSATGSTITADQVTAVAAQNLPLLKEMNKAVGMYDAESKGM